MANKTVTPIATNRTNASNTTHITHITHMSNTTKETNKTSQTRLPNGTKNVNLIGPIEKLRCNKLRN